MRKKIKQRVINKQYFKIMKRHIVPHSVVEHHISVALSQHQTLAPLDFIFLNTIRPLLGLKGVHIQIRMRNAIAGSNKPLNSLYM